MERASWQRAGYTKLFTLDIDEKDKLKEVLRRLKNCYLVDRYAVYRSSHKGYHIIVLLKWKVHIRYTLHLRAYFLDDYWRLWYDWLAYRSKLYSWIDTLFDNWKFLSAVYDYLIEKFNKLRGDKYDM